MKTIVSSKSMKNAILCGTLLAGLSLTATAQVKIGNNPNQIVTGARLQVDGDNTTTTAAKLLIDNAGNVGIGTATPNAPLQLANTTANRKVVLFDNQNNDNQYYGFGVNGNLLRYQTDLSNSDHGFFSGINATTSRELMRIKGNGNVGIGTAAPATNLHVSSTGTGGTGVFPTNTANTALRLENTGNGQSVIQHLLAKDAAGATKQAIFGINPTTVGGNGIFLLSRDGSNDFVMDLANGNFGLGGLPGTTQKLAVNGNFSASGNASISGNTIVTGNVGIGTTAPNAPLQFANTTVNRKVVLYDGSNNDHQYYGFGVNGFTLRYQTESTSADHVFFAATSSTASNELFRIRGNGNATLAGSLTQNSDIRLKTDIVDNTYGLKEILKLRTINYRFKDAARGKDKKVGFIAQEVKAAMPELVSTANDEMKTLSVSYAEMTAVLTKAIQEQQAQIEKLTAALEKTTANLEKASAKNEQLEQKYDALRAEVNTIKAEVVPEKYAVK